MKNDSYDNPNMEDEQKEELVKEEELKDKYSFGTYIAYAVVFVMVLIVFGITGTYAYYTMEVENKFTTTVATANADCFDVTLSSSGTYSLGAYNYPITDDYAKKTLTPLKVDVKNSCSSGAAIGYKLYITTLPTATNNMPDKAMKIYVKKGDSEVKATTAIDKLTKITTGNSYDVLKKAVQENGKASDLVAGNYYEVLSGSVSANSTDSYSFLFWIDYNEGGGGNNSTKGKTFKVLVSAIIN